MLLCAALGSVLVPATATRAHSDREISYRCGDLVVVGRFSIVGEQSAPGSSPLPKWQSRYDLRMRIIRVLRGSEPKPVIAATVVAHDPIRTDRDFLAVLEPTDAGIYTLEAAALWDIRPRPTLLEPCR